MDSIFQNRSLNLLDGEKEKQVARYFEGIEKVLIMEIAYHFVLNEIAAFGFMPIQMSRSCNLYSR